MLKFLKKFMNTKKYKYLDRIQIKVVVDSEEIFNDYVDKCRVLGNKASIVKEFDNVGSRKYLYYPKSSNIDANQMLEVAYTLLGRSLDYVIVSNTLDDFPYVGGTDLEDVIIYSVDSCRQLKSIEDGHLTLCGKLLRLPGYKKSDDTFCIHDRIKNVQLLSESYLGTKTNEVPEFHKVELLNNYKSNKKMIFVMPIFMAVGGVERNTVEIMRALKKEYDFCVITMERHAKGQGSLNHQLDGLCVANYDLRELVEFGDYFDAFEQLKQLYHPEVIWLCNNSPWLESNMLKFREIFGEQRIVAQDVYDTKYGWIEYYNTEGMHSVDKYIAVNEKIKSVFIEKYGIDEKNISVIYSAIDDGRIRNTLQRQWNRLELCSKYEISPDKKHIALIGRMTEQKDPIRYLKMIKEVYQNHEELEFLLVGDGTLGNQVDEFILDNNLQSVVKRIKFVESTPELFQVLDGLVLTSVYEGLAIVSIEAMCIGVPILSTDTGDLKLFLDKTNGGRIIDETIDDKMNFELWYHSLEQYVQNSKCHSMEILDFFSAVNIAKQYSSLFNEIN